MYIFFHGFNVCKTRVDVLLGNLFTAAIPYVDALPNKPMLLEIPPRCAGIYSSSTTCT
ncbi:hypothetical protein Hanom_Chr08g00699251 [Helianthus anomalus]